ncbi:GDSL-type esterase/lipase family protein [Paenibacillus sp. 2RAB27]|uniref:SGNH/GDSL hydrolase family protein n=1 Tax=Paenibacillus sp. 2RAB27 TaxID=3232991 RepID=UPI003F9D84DF
MMTTMLFPLKEAKVELHHVTEWVEDEIKGLRLCRIPEKLRLTLNEIAQRNAQSAAGSEIRFRMIGERVEVGLWWEPHLETPITTMAALVIGSLQAEIFYLHTGYNKIVIKKYERRPEIEGIHPQNSYDRELYRLVLPYQGKVYLSSVEGEVEPPYSLSVPGKGYLAYGSSITHGASAWSPTGTYAFRLAQLLGSELRNFGLAGGAKLEPQLADYLIELEGWDIATIELGINVVYDWTAEVFRQAVNIFLERLAAGLGERKLFVTDMFWFAMDAAGDPKSDLFRDIVQQAVLKRNHPGIIGIPGRDLLDPENQTHDLVHPSQAGMEQIAQRLYSAISVHL